MVAYLDDTDEVIKYDGTDWSSVAPAIAGIGSNVASTTKTDTFSASVAVGATTAITGLTVDFTPTSASSKVLVVGYVTTASSTGSTGRSVNVIVKRDSTAVGVGAADGNRTQVTTGSQQAVTLGQNNSTFAFIDSPATTDEVTYSVDIHNGEEDGTRTLYVNRTSVDADAAKTPRASSSITAIEVAP
jgi:hypothetical protein